jgi:hypothetical protein
VVTQSHDNDDSDDDDDDEPNNEVFGVATVIKLVKDHVSSGSAFRLGTDVMIFLNIFGEKFIEKMAFLTQNKAKLCKMLIITLVFDKQTLVFFAENCQKSQKIVIITLFLTFASMGNVKCAIDFKFH